jgi:hypothetical protein
VGIILMAKIGCCSHQFCFSDAGREGRAVANAE